MILPSKSLSLVMAGLALVWTGTVLGLPFWGALVVTVVIWTWIIAGFFLTFSLKPEISYSLPRYFSLGHTEELKFHFDLPPGKNLYLRARLALPDTWDVPEKDPESFNVQEADFVWKVHPPARGTFEIQEITWRLRLTGGLWIQQGTQRLNHRISVLPDVRGLGKYLKLSRQTRLGPGVHTHRQSGAGLELDSLREYQSGDTLRDIDWKVSSRVGKTVVKQWMPETQAQVILLLDSGRNMTSMTGGISAFDRAVSAVMVLARTILDSGDILRIKVFNTGTRAELPPVKGRRALPRILKFLSDQSTEQVDSNHGQVLRELLAGKCRRSYVFVVTDVADPSMARRLNSYYPLLAKKHWPVLLLLRPSELDPDLSKDEVSDREVFYQTALQELALERLEALELLRARGWRMVDCTAEELTPRLVNTYLGAKRFLFSPTGRSLD